MVVRYAGKPSDPRTSNFLISVDDKSRKSTKAALRRPFSFGKSSRSLLIVSSAAKSVGLRATISPLPLNLKCLSQFCCRGEINNAASNQSAFP